MKPRSKHRFIRTSSPRLRSQVGGVLLSFASALALHAQSPATDDGDANVVTLPSFSVESQQDDSFIGREAMSTTRTGVALENLAQSVVVVNEEFVDAMSPQYIANIMTYIGGGQTGTLNWTGSTRYMMRGYTSEGDFADGFRMPGGNTHFNWVERVEVIKGPSAIFVTNSANTVGGMVNKISKSPTSYRVGEVAVEYGLWDTGSVSFDVGGPLTQDGKLQYRVISSYTDFERYYDNSSDQRWSIMPMLKYVFSETSEAWIKFEKHDHKYSAYEGIPMDGRTGRIIDVSPKWNAHEDDPLNWREGDYTRLWGQFTTRPSDFLAIRLAGLYSIENTGRVQSIVSPVGAATPSQQPDGSWAYVPYAQYTIPPNYVAGQLIPRTTTADVNWFGRREVQNDYVFNFETADVSHTFLIGGILRGDPEVRKNYSSGSTSVASSSPIDPFNLRFPGTVVVGFDEPPINRQEQDNAFAKLYALETASFWDERVILTVGASRNRFAQNSRTDAYNQVTNVASPTETVPQAVLYKNLVQYSALVKPLPNVSVFYGYNVNFAANPIQFGQFLPPQEGKQWELGVKSNWLNNRLNVSVAYFDIEQLNNTVQPFPQTIPRSLILVPGVLSSGFDGDISFAVNDNLTIVGAFAWFDATTELRHPWDKAPMPYDGKIYSELPVNNVSERNLSLWARYKFSEGPLDGLAIGIGANALSKRAITDNANSILYGYVPSQILVDASLSYERGKFRYQLNVDNVLNKDYLYAARSQQVLVPGTPTNVSGSITYKF